MLIIQNVEILAFNALETRKAPSRHGVLSLSYTLYMETAKLNISYKKLLMPCVKFEILFAIYI